MLPPVANRFVAGETTPVALDHVRRMNDAGVKVILNRLGEHYTDGAAAAADADAYRQLLRDLDGSGLAACLSVKPSQLGLLVSESFYRERYRAVVEAAADHDAFVWSDMEDSTTTDATLDAFETVAREFPGRVGQCLQANLRRTRRDVERLADVPGKIRLVKGAYDEPSDVAYTRAEAVNESFRENLELLFQEYDGGIAVATHDPELIDYAKRLGETYDRDFEFQMLMGVREDAQRELAAGGYDVWQYAPYGRRWLAYFYRRIRERKGNLVFALRALVS
ncbi:proline dehydrogenase family protein [Haloplanus sp. GCM10025708]|uniref:proline dehydrogenase family protein n=1 Tax=Haloferacaceae TaxID=1644056 RepID=UPI003624519E